MKKKVLKWLGIVVAALVVLVVIGAIIGPDEEELAEPTAAVSSTPTATPSETAEPTPTATPTPSKTKATATPTPTPTETKEAADEVSWVNVALLSEMNDETFNDEFKSPLFKAKTGKLKVTWEMDPIFDEYNWNIVVFREGQTPDNSMGVGEPLFSEATFGGGLDDEGSVKFTVTAGKKYYVWMAIWHVNALVTVDEAR